MIAAAEQDLSDPRTAELLRPLHKVLDRVWLVPVHAFQLQSLTNFPIFLKAPLKVLNGLRFFKDTLQQTKVTLGMDAATRSFRNLTLSFRGSERQAPNTLQLALRFSVIMEERANSGEHHSGMTVDERITSIVQSFHMSPGLQAKHRLDEDKMKAVNNIVAGTCAASWL